MTSANALATSISLLLLRNLKEGMETGRISDMSSAQTEINAAMAELNRALLLEEHVYGNDLIGGILLEIRSLQEKVAQYEAGLSKVQLQAQNLKQDTTQIASRAEACNLMVKQQQKENSQVLAAVERAKASASVVEPTCVAPAPSPVDPSLRPAPSSSAVVSFPGGPRTITIYPPGCSHFRQVIRDENGDIILTLGRTKPLCREGAFIGPLDEVDWFELTRVYGRGLNTSGAPTTPPSSRRRNSSGPPPCPSPVGGSSNMAPPQYGLSSSSPHDSSQDSRVSSSGAKSETISPTSSVLSSPTLARGKKRTRNDEDEDDNRGVLLTTETHEEASALVTLRTANEPVTPKLVRCNESDVSEAPSKKKLRSSAAQEGLSSRSLERV